MKHIETMTKLYTLSIDKAAKKGEVSNAKQQLTRLAKKHKMNLDKFIASLNVKPQGLKGMLNNISACMNEPKKQAASNATKKRSRRSLIIEHLKEGAWTIGALAIALTEMGYPDIKANKKAVSGTMYDFHTNKGWFFRRDAETDHITVEIPASFI